MASKSVSEAASGKETGESNRLTAGREQALTIEFLNSSSNSTHRQEKIRQTADDARYRASGVLPADFQIDGLAKPQRKKYAVYEQPASQALQSPPPLSDVLKAPPYDSSVKLNVQITNVPEVSKGLTREELTNYFSTVVRVGATTSSESVIHIAKHLARPDAVNDDLINLAKHYSQSSDQFNKDVKALVGVAMRQAEKITEQIDKPMTPKQRAEMAGAILPQFVTEGRVMDRKVVEQMGLKRMSADELKALGIEYKPVHINLEADEFSIKANIPGDARAYFRAVILSPGVVHVTDLNKGLLPKGTGGEFLALALKGHNTLPTKSLIMEGIINKETLVAYKEGIDPANSLLGKCASNALKSLEIVPKAYKWQMTEDKLNLIIETR